MVGWSPRLLPYSYDDLGQTLYNVYSHTGQLIISFDDKVDCQSPFWEFLPGNRVAIARIACFKVRDLSSAQELATGGPGDEAPVFTFAPGGMLATNSPGSLLAFCPDAFRGASLALHVYDTDSWQPVACLLAGGMAGVMDPGTSGLFWGVHGWMLAYRPYRSHLPHGRLQILVRHANMGSADTNLHHESCHTYKLRHAKILRPYVAVMKCPALSF